MISQNYVRSKDTNNRLLVRHMIRSRYKNKQKNIENNKNKWRDSHAGHLLDAWIDRK